MVKLELYNKLVVDKDKKYIPVNKFELIYKVNVVEGNSATGKTYFVDNLNRAKNESTLWSYKCNKEVIVCNNLDDFVKALDTEDKLIVADEDVVNLIRKNKYINKINNCKSYMLLFDRGAESVIETNVKALYKLETVDIINGIKIYSTKQYLDLNYKGTDYCKDAKFLVTEDFKSGRLFWKSMLSKIEVIEDENPSNSSVPSMIIKAMQMDSSCKVIVALDYDFGSIVVDKIIRNSEIDNDKLLFIPMESFEEVICNSDFILSKYPEMTDRVINYKKYLNASYKSTGKYFSSLLYNYVRVTSPVEKKRNQGIFYEKGMENFKECFIDNCCAYRLKNCKLRYNGDKKKAMLSNKFEFLREYM